MSNLKLTAPQRRYLETMPNDGLSFFLPQQNRMVERLSDLGLVEIWWKAPLHLTKMTQAGREYLALQKEKQRRGEEKES